MNKLLKKITCVLVAGMLLGTFDPAISFTAEAKEQSFTLDGNVYEFNDKSEYEIDSASPSTDADNSIRLGNLSMSGNIQKTYDKDGVTAYEIADGEIFDLDFTYISSLKDAGKDDWHLIKDGKDVVNGSELDDDIDLGALILQTSFDGNNWVDCHSYVNIGSDKNFGEGQINNIQLANGCYYRVIAAYEIERRTQENRFIDDYEKEKVAQVYTFYASYKDKVDTKATGKKFNFYAGAKTSAYTVKTKKNNYSGQETIDVKDPHYGWDLGYFCLSGYTEKGDSDDVYLKEVGAQVKLTFHLDQDIKKLNGNSDLIIESDKDGSDEDFKVEKHNMKHGELIIRHTDSENNTKEVKYSDFLAALTSPGADTAIQLFEEGDYEVHLDYAITDKDKIDSTTYYKTSFNFKIRNANCMVYIFDSQTGTELYNGDVTKSGFRVDTAKSKYTQITMTRKILNNEKNGLTDIRYNGAISDGNEYTEEGIYYIYANNPSLVKVKEFEAIIYVGDDPILAAYTKNLDKPDKYTIEQLNNMVDKGYTITDNGDIKEPETTTTTTVTTPEPETTTEISETTTNVMTSAEPAAVESPRNTDASDKNDEKDNSSALPLVGGGVGAAAVGSIVIAALKKKK